MTICSGPLVRSPDSELELYGFLDSSKKGYTAVVYLKVFPIIDPVKVHPIMAKRFDAITVDPSPTLLDRAFMAEGQPNALAATL
ncbi:hypothetical protein PR048_004930 [Dryococelus australis]|uniref:Uncharacterized protein n=1 Tax=Dryococelus australis TaxID=614101 RepID=A0ABQ9I6S4_9NEOP|nr:hypothetical protein PR048_004930 [Dryococelus australis]